MNKRYVIGKRIVAVKQEWRPLEQDGHGACWDVFELLLEDGTRLVPITVEMDGDYATEIKVVRPASARGAGSGETP